MSDNTEINQKFDLEIEGFDKEILSTVVEKAFKESREMMDFEDSYLDKIISDAVYNVDKSIDKKIKNSLFTRALAASIQKQFRKDKDSAEIHINFK